MCARTRINRKNPLSSLARYTVFVYNVFVAVILSFGDAATEDIYNGENSRAARRIPIELWPRVRRVLDQLAVVTDVLQMAIPPANRLEKLRGKRLGAFSVRVNQQFRVTFRFENGNASEVLCEDYH